MSEPINKIYDPKLLFGEVLEIIIAPSHENSLKSLFQPLWKTLEIKLTLSRTETEKGFINLKCQLPSGMIIKRGKTNIDLLHSGIYEYKEINRIKGQSISLYPKDLQKASVALLEAPIFLRIISSNQNIERRMRKPLIQLGLYYPAGWAAVAYESAAAHVNKPKGHHLISGMERLIHKLENKNLSLLELEDFTKKFVSLFSNQTVQSVHELKNINEKLFMPEHRMAFYLLKTMISHVLYTSERGSYEQASCE